MPQVNIVIPCYNEAKRIPLSRLVSFARENPLVAFTFVDDGSTDSTKSLLDAACASMPNALRNISLNKNCGKAEAVRQGMLYAMESDAEIVGYWDADLATPLSLIPSFIHELSDKSWDVVLGSRVKMLGTRVRRNSIRHFLGRIFATFVSVILQLDIYDSQCGAKLFRNSDILKSVFQKRFRTRWIFDAEIIGRIILERRRRHLAEFSDIAKEFPVHEWEDVGKSKVRPLDYFLAGLDILWLLVWYRKALAHIQNPKSKGKTSQQ